MLKAIHKGTGIECTSCKYSRTTAQGIKKYLITFPWREVYYKAGKRHEMPMIWMDEVSENQITLL